LWRIERESSRKGTITIFNRSHYEDVLVVRVHNLVPKDVWKERYEMINDYERRLVANGTRILKFFLHISNEEQLSRLWARVDDPLKNWKLSESDFKERANWSDYQEAYEEVLSRCSSKHAPWFVIPANHKWYRDYVITRIVMETLQSMNLAVPEPIVNIKELRLKYGPEPKRSREESHKPKRIRDDSPVMSAPIAEADKSIAKDTKATETKKNADTDDRKQNDDNNADKK